VAGGGRQRKTVTDAEPDDADSPAAAVLIDKPAAGGGHVGEGAAPPSLQVAAQRNQTAHFEAATEHPPAEQTGAARNHATYRWKSQAGPGAG
jgi:hypothetical protein